MAAGDARSNSPGSAVAAPGNFRELGNEKGLCMNPDRMLALAQGLAEAKSRQDVSAALKFLHPDVRLENPAFGSCIRGLDKIELALTRWFSTFPDYEVVLEGHASNRDHLVCWGHVRMTMTGLRFGGTPNGQRATFPVFIRFTFADDLIASEYFFFDLSALCAQSGVSTDAARQLLFGESTLSPATAGQDADLRPSRLTNQRN